MLIAGLLSIGFVACKKNKNNGPEEIDYATEIIGKWNLEKLELLIESEEGTETETDYAEEGSYIKFRENGTYLTYIYDEGADEWELEEGLYSVENKKLTLSDANHEDEEFYDIKSMTQNSMLLFSEEDGTIGNIEYHFEITAYLYR